MTHVMPAAAHMSAGPRGSNRQNASSGAQANRPRQGGFCGWRHASRPNRRHTNAAECSRLITQRTLEGLLQLRAHPNPKAISPGRGGASGRGIDKAHENGDAMGIVDVHLTVLSEHGYWFWMLGFRFETARRT